MYSVVPTTRALNMQGAIPSRHPKYRTKLCRNFVNGDCPFGQKCSFLHTAPKTDPATSSLAQQRFPWNPVLLQQLLSLSNHQASLKKMPRRSPPPSQGPQLVEEGPSPTTSLLLSKSDCTSFEQVPQTRHSGKRKKYACRHFVRTGGWCPAGGQCKFQHDADALSSTSVRKTEYAPVSAVNVHGEEGRTISGGVLMGIQSPSPPIVNETHLEPSRYAEAELMRPYPTMCWPSYTWQPYQAYYAAMPTTTAMPVPATIAPPSVAQQSVYSPPQPQLQAQTVPPSETQTSLPMGSYQVNGTTYFPSSMPSVPPPPPVPYTHPMHALPYNPTMAPAYPLYAPPGMPAGYYDANQTRAAAPHTSTAFDPFASDRMVPRDLPVIPRLEDYPMSPVRQDVRACPPLGSGETSTGTDTVPEHEFPYQPPKDQRVGHARRISVNVKKHGRVNSG